MLSFKIVSRASPLSALTSRNCTPESLSEAMLSYDCDRMEGLFCDNQAVLISLFNVPAARIFNPVGLYVWLLLRQELPIRIVCEATGNMYYTFADCAAHIATIGEPLTIYDERRSVLKSTIHDLPSLQDEFERMALNLQWASSQGLFRNFLNKLVYETRFDWMLPYSSIGEGLVRRGAATSEFEPRGECTMQELWIESYLDKAESCISGGVIPTGGSLTSSDQGALIDSMIDGLEDLHSMSIYDRQRLSRLLSYKLCHKTLHRHIIDMEKLQ